MLTMMGLTDIYVCNGIYNDVTDQDFIDFFANDCNPENGTHRKKGGSEYDHQ